MLKARPIALKPLGLRVTAEPRWRSDSQRVERCTHGFTDQLQAVERTDRAEDMRRVRPLPTAGFDEPPGCEPL